MTLQPPLLRTPRKPPKRLSLATESLRSAPSTASRRIIPSRLLQAPLCAHFSPLPICCVREPVPSCAPATCSLTPDSIAKLLRPAYQDKFDFVAPLYSRHKFQGLLARNLVYPMCRAVFGAAIRELYTDEWGFSGRLAASCLNQNVWHEEAIQTRPEAWMALSAISSNFRCCQTFLGEKPPAARGPATDIVEVLRQTVGTLFWCLETRPSLWLDAEPSPSVTTFGPDHELTTERSDLDPHRIFEMFRTGVTELEPILSSILHPDTHVEIKNLVAIEEGKFRFKPDLWVRTLYDFAASYHHSVINRSHLVQALAPSLSRHDPLLSSGTFRFLPRGNGGVQRNALLRVRTAKTVPKGEMED